MWLILQKSHTPRHNQEKCLNSNANEKLFLLARTKKKNSFLTKERLTDYGIKKKRKKENFDPKPFFHHSAQMWQKKHNRSQHSDIHNNVPPMYCHLRRKHKEIHQRITQKHRFSFKVKEMLFSSFLRFTWG